VVQRQDAAEYPETLNYISFDVGVRHLGVAASRDEARRHGDPSVAGLDVTDEEDARTVLLYTYLENALPRGGRRTSLSLSNNLLVRSGAYRPSGWRFAITL
jgi:hypothetical protein